MSWRSAIPQLGEVVFPGISSPFHIYGETSKQKTLANLPLQVVIYFNVCFFPFWFSSTIIILVTKVNCLSNLYRMVAITILVSSTCIEILRLYLGYFGNLSEKIPEVAAFWMLSVLLQLPLQTFLVANTQLCQPVVEFVIQGIMLVFVSSEIIFGFIALRKASKMQAARFHLAQMQQKALKTQQY